MKLFPLWDVETRTCSPLGMPMCQNRLAVPTWSYAMEVLRPARVIEIGSYNGAFATALGLHGRFAGFRVITYDVNACDERIVPIGRAIGVEFRTASCWNVEAEIAALIAGPGVSYVLCDGGDKPRELAAFARYLKPGDVIAAHDYDALAFADPAVPQLERPWPWCEMRAEVGARIAAECDLEPWLQEHFDFAGWLTFRKKERA